jgi:hypothetical protein
MNSYLLIASHGAEILALCLFAYGVPSVFVIAIHRLRPNLIRILVAGILWMISLSWLPCTHCTLPVIFLNAVWPMPVLWQAFAYLEPQILPTWFRFAMWSYVLIEAYGFLRHLLPRQVIALQKRLHFVGGRASNSTRADSMLPCLRPEIPLMRTLRRLISKVSRLN